MAKVELKQPVVAEIAELFNGAKGAVVVDYRGLTVEQDTHSVATFHCLPDRQYRFAD